MPQTDKLYALHEVSLTEDDRQLLRDLRDMLKQFLVVETEILELSRMAVLLARERALEEMEDGEFEYSD